MDARYSLMIKDVKSSQLEQELTYQKFILTADSGAEPDIAATNAKVVEVALAKVWSLFWQVTAKYQNGYDSFGAKSPGYPSEWLSDVGFGDFQATHAQFDKQQAMFAKTLSEASAIFRRTHRDTNAIQSNIVV